MKLAPSTTVGINAGADHNFFHALGDIAHGCLILVLLNLSSFAKGRRPCDAVPATCLADRLAGW
jgi:hypothetical protein